MKRKSFSYKDVRVDVYRGDREFDMRLTHLPTGLMVSGVGSGDEFRTRDPLMLALRDKVEKEPHGHERE